MGNSYIDAEEYESDGSAGKLECESSIGNMGMRMFRLCQAHASRVLKMDNLDSHANQYNKELSLSP